MPTIEEKREKIREGVALKLYNRHRIYAVGWMDLSDSERALYLGDTDGLLDYLHENDCVLLLKANDWPIAFEPLIEQ